MKEIGKFTLVVVILVLVGLGAFRVSWPLYLLKEQVTITVGMSGERCVVLVEPEQIRTKWEHRVTWQIAGNCPNHIVSVDAFVSIDHGTPWDPTRNRVKEVRAVHGQVIEATVESKDPARQDWKRYGYLILIDGRAAGGDPELRICPDWPC